MPPPLKLKFEIQYILMCTLLNSR